MGHGTNGPADDLVARQLLCARGVPSRPGIEVTPTISRRETGRAPGKSPRSARPCRLGLFDGEDDRLLQDQCREAVRDRDGVWDYSSVAKGMSGQRIPLRAGVRCDANA